MFRKALKYKRHEWRLVKTWTGDAWNYSVQWKGKFLFFTQWNTINREVVSICKWDQTNKPGFDTSIRDHRGWSTVFFYTKRDARRFVEFFENYRKQWYRVRNELVHVPYIYVR